MRVCYPVIAAWVVLGTACMPRARLLPQKGEARVVLWEGAAVVLLPNEETQLLPRTRVTVQDVTQNRCRVVVDGPVALTGKAWCPDLGYVVRHPTPVYLAPGDNQSVFEVNGDAVVAPQRRQGDRVLVVGRDGVTWKGWVSASALGVRPDKAWPHPGLPTGLWTCDPEISLFQKPDGKRLFSLPAILCRLSVRHVQGDWAEVEFDNGVIRAGGYVDRRKLHPDDKPAYHPAARPMRTKSSTPVYPEVSSDVPIARLEGGVTVWASLASGKRVRVQTTFPYVEVIGWVERDALGP